LRKKNERKWRGKEKPVSYGKNSYFKKRKMIMTERTIEIPISKSNFNAALEAFLRQVGMVQYSEDVLDIQVTGYDGPKDQVILTVKIKKQEVEKETTPTILIDKGVPEDELEIPAFLDRRPKQDALDWIRSQA